MLRIIDAMESFEGKIAQRGAGSPGNKARNLTETFQRDRPYSPHGGETKTIFKLKFDYTRKCKG